MKKIGFWPLFAIVTGGQVGSGIFMLPASLAPYGILGIVGLIIAAVGALSLAVTFAMLCFSYPKTGGPHVYVEVAFGKSAAFFTGWTYWVVSWVSSTAVIVAAIGYFMPILGDYPKEIYITIEIGILLLITLINLNGVSTAGHFEATLSIIKFLPLLILPCASLIYFNSANLVIDPSLENHSSPTILRKVTLITLWGFIGLEVATTPANSVLNPRRNIPLAVILGTLFVSIIYFVNSLGIMGLIPGEELKNSSAAFAEATQLVFGGNWHIPVSIIASIVCLSSLNAWVLTGGQIVLGLAEDGLMPQIFSRKNAKNAPYLGLLISGLGTIPLLFLTNEPTFAQQIAAVIDFSVIAYLFVYLMSVLSFLYINMKNKVIWQGRNLIGLFALLFCLWVIFNTEAKVLIIATSFVLSGLPLYLFWYRKKQLN